MTPRPTAPDPAGAVDPAAGLAARVDAWVAAGIITAAQAQRILAAEAGTGAESGAGAGTGGGREAAAPAGASGTVPAPPLREPAAPRSSLVTEALGYVGGVLVVVAAVTITGRYWAVLGTGGRLAVAFGAAAVLLAAGAAVPAAPATAGARLRAVTWLASTITFAVGVALLVERPPGGDDGAAVLLTAAATAGYGGVLWWRTRAVLQHVAFVAALAVAAGAAADLLPRGAEPGVGLAIWGVGAAWLLLGWGAVVARRPAYVLGGLAVIVGSQVAAGTADWGTALALASAAALVAAGVLGRDLVVLGVGSVAMLVAVPVAMQRWFPDTLGAPLALLGAGLLLVAGAFVTARRRREQPGRAAPAAPPALAAGLAAGLAVAVAAVVLVLGT